MKLGGVGFPLPEFADMPRGESRYIACSQQVPVATMDRINQAIRESQPETLAD